MKKEKKQSKRLRDKIKRAEERTKRWASGMDVKFPEVESPEPK
jgi:hypothetical protein